MMDQKGETQDDARSRAGHQNEVREGRDFDPGRVGDNHTKETYDPGGREAYQSAFCRQGKQYPKASSFHEYLLLFLGMSWDSANSNRPAETQIEVGASERESF